MNIGKIKWLGGYNAKKKSYNNYGFLEDMESHTELFFRINDVHKDSLMWKCYEYDGNVIEDSERFSGAYVVFEIDSKSNKGSKAVNVIHINDFIEICGKNIVKQFLYKIINDSPKFTFPCELAAALIDVFLDEIELIKYFPIEGKMQICITALNKRVWNEDTPYLKLIYDIIKDKNKTTDIFDLNRIVELSKNMIVRGINNINIFSLLDIDKKFELLFYALSNNIWSKDGINDFIHQLFIEAYKISESYKINNNFLDIREHVNNISEQEKIKQKIVSWYRRLPIGIERQFEFFNYLAPKDICDSIWQSENCGINYWAWLNSKAKITFIYRMCQSFSTSEELFNRIDKTRLRNVMIEEENELIRGLFEITLGKFFKGQKDFFRIGHNMIQDYIIENASNKNLVDLLYGVTARCNDPHFGNLRKKYRYNITSNVALCEGKWWKNQQCTFCPRIGRACSIELFHDTTWSWDTWTIYDLIRNCRITPNVDGLDNEIADEYMYRLNGWINRIIEINDKLKCSSCGQVMINRFAYSKNLAKYNATVADCQEDGSEHDKGIYLNHCNGCYKIIDSRESHIQQEDTQYYLCIHCGRGKANHPTFKEGDVCPGCGAKKMTSVGKRIFTCWKCGHTIKAPS